MTATLQATPDVLEPGELTLAELAAAANREHELVVAAGAAMVEHAILAGEALASARARCGYGDWAPWLDANFAGGDTTANVYIRLAHYQEAIRSEGVRSIAGAAAYVRSLTGPYGKSNYPEATHEEARRLHDAGVSYSEIGRLLGVNRGTAREWCDPAHAATRRIQKAATSRAHRERRAAEQAAARDRATKSAARKAGGAIAKLYADAERTQDDLAQAQREATDPEARRELSEAGALHRQYRDKIVRALGVS